MAKAEMRTAESSYIKIRIHVMNLIMRAGAQKTPLPSIQQLSEQFQVSRPTVCKALKALTEEGFIIGKRGIGSFTNPKREPGFSISRTLPVAGFLLGDGMNVHLDYYLASITAEIEKAITHTPTVLHRISLDSWNPDTILAEIKYEQLDGIISHTQHKGTVEALEKLAEEGLPVVFGMHETDKYCSVVLDYGDFGYRCGKKLIEENRKNIVFLLNRGDWASQLEGLRKAYREAGIPLNENLFFTEYSQIRNDLPKLIRGAPVDAVYSAMLWNNEISDLLLAADSDIWKRCCLIEPDFALPPEKPFHRITATTPFEEYGKTLAYFLKRKMDDPSFVSQKKIRIGMKLYKGKDQN